MVQQTCRDGLFLIQVQVEPDGECIEGPRRCDLQLQEVVSLLPLAHAFEEVLERLRWLGQHLVRHVIQEAGLIPLVPPAPVPFDFQWYHKPCFCDTSTVLLILLQKYCSVDDTIAIVLM